EIAILDETDSGLDIDALRVVAEGVNALVGPDLGVLIITHYQRILNYVKPHFVHVMVDGQIQISGGPELALKLESLGYDWLREGKEVTTPSPPHPPSTSASASRKSTGSTTPTNMCSGAGGGWRRRS